MKKDYSVESVAIPHYFVIFPLYKLSSAIHFFLSPPPSPLSLSSLSLPLSFGDLHRIFPLQFQLDSSFLGNNFL